MKKTFKLSIPNDYNSEADDLTAIADCYDGDAEAAQNDDARALYEKLAGAAKSAGLAFVEESDFGAIWSGTDAQFEKCVELLPGWAKRYALRGYDRAEGGKQ